MSLEALGRTVRRIARDRRVPSHLIRHLRWLAGRRGGPEPDDAPVVAYPVKTALEEAAASLLVALQRARIVAFLVDDRGHEIAIGTSDEDRARTVDVIRNFLPDWRVEKLRDSFVVSPSSRGAGGGQIRVTLWQKNNLGEREHVGVRGLERILADEELGTTELAGTTVPAMPGFVPEALRLRPRFPIDAVITWVDGADADWQRRKQKALATTDPDALSIAAARFRSRDELRYLLRSIDAFAPFFRHIFVVTDCRPPHWANADHPQITFVEQTPLLGGTPVFNSLAVETSLHHIADLSEHYVYFNDDMFLARPVDPELFFGPTGDLRLTTGPRIRSGPPQPGEDTFETGAKQARDLIHAEFGWIPERSANHVPLPQRKSLAEEMERRFETALEQTRTSTFRASTNTTSATGLVHYLGAQLGLVGDSAMTWDYVDTSGRFAASHYGELAAGAAVDCICCNDGGVPVSPARDAVAEETLTEFLTGYFPTPSRFEVGS